MQLAEPAVPLLLERQTTYRGGWPQGFISSPCSGDAPVKCQPYDWYNLNCCPSGQRCSKAMPAHCCPSDEDCTTAVRNTPVCANSTWTMYLLYVDSLSGLKDYFCCPDGMVGLIPSTGSSGICQEKGPNIPSTMLATVAAQFGAATATNAAGGAPTGFSGNAGNGDGGGSSAGTGTGSSSHQTGGTNGPAITGGGGGGPTAGSNVNLDGGGGSGGVSAGSIAGIVIGSLAFFALAIALILWWHRRSLRRHPRGGTAESSKPVGGAQARPVQAQHDAPEVVQYVPAAAGVLLYGPPAPHGAAPAYSPPQNVAEIAGVPRAEIEAPRS